MDPLIRWTPVFNTESEAVPPFGAMQSADLGVNNDGQLKIKRPTVNGSTDILFNGPSPIPANKPGMGNETFPAIVAYDEAWTDAEDAGGIIPGDILGALAGSWFLQRNYAGFRVLDAGNGLANVTRHHVNVMDFYDPTAWYAGEGGQTFALTNTAPLTVNLLLANDSVRGMTDRVISSIGAIVYSTTGATTPKIRLGIYQSLSNRDLAPSKLLYDSGDMSIAALTNVFAKKTGLNIRCPAGYLYWYTSILTYTGTSPVLAGTDDPQTAFSWLGTPETPPTFGGTGANLNDYYSKAMTFGALPDPAGMTLVKESDELGADGYLPSVYVQYAP